MFRSQIGLSEDFLAKNPNLRTQPNLVAWHMEPTAENLLLFVKRSLENKFPEGFIDGIKIV